MKPRTRARTPSSIASNQSSKSKPSAATAASFVVSLVMAWSPFQRANAGIIWIEQPGDYANPIPTTAAMGPPERLAELLSGYLEAMTEVVFAHQSTVAKIIGDAIHVLFGAPADQPDAASRAIACALALDTHAERYRQEWVARGAPLGVTRIGVHAGPATVGNFGGGRFYDYTAYGDTINTAARLEAVNKQLGTRVCVSAAAAERAPGFIGRPVGDLLLRGRSEPMRVFEPLWPDERTSRHTLAYIAAFSKL